MKKLLLVLMVVAMASFLFVGCFNGGVTPDPDPDPDPVATDCPTVAVTSQVAVAGKNYIKAGTQTITVSFAVPTAPVSVFVGALLKDNPDGVPSGASEVVMYTADGGLTYTGTVLFDGDCDEAYIYVLTCDTCAPCKYPYTVDGVGPFAEIKITVDDCECAGCEIIFSTVIDPEECAEDVECCGDDCSGLANWSVVLYEGDPFDECCDPDDCEEPIGSCSGTGCDVDCETDCLTASDDPYYAVITLVDEVGNETVYYAKIVLSGDGLTEDCAILVYEGTAADAPTCVTWDEDTTDTVGACL